MAASSLESRDDSWCLSSAADAGEYEDSEYGRGSKLWAPYEESRWGNSTHRAADKTRFCSNVSMGSVTSLQLLQEIPADQFSRGIGKAKKGNRKAVGSVSPRTGKDESTDSLHGDSLRTPYEELQWINESHKGANRFASNVSMGSITSSQLLQEIPAEQLKVKKNQEPVGSLSTPFFAGEEKESDSDHGDMHQIPSREPRRVQRAHSAEESRCSTKGSLPLDEMLLARALPECMEDLASALDGGEGGEFVDGRYSKHRAPPEELRRDFRAFDSTASIRSTASSLFMQEIITENKRTGRRKARKGVGCFQSDDSEYRKTGASNTNTARSKYSSAWRGLNVSVQPTAQFKKVMARRQGYDQSEHAVQNSTDPIAEGASDRTNVELISSAGPVPKAPSMPQTGRPQPGSRFQAVSFFPMLGGAAAHMDSDGKLGKAYHQELMKVRKSLEGLQVDPNELHWEEQIGAGSTAEVFKGAWDRLPGKELAIKRLNMSTRCVEQLTQEVTHLREIALLASLQHDNLVKFYGFSFVEQHILVTEFCRGGPVCHLLHVIDPLQLVIEQQLKMCSDVACAMDFLHKSKPQIIHRDLKSPNLLLVEAVTSTTDVPHVKVSDFGLSKMKDEESGWRDMTVGVGTAHWMAPEVALGSYDEKADIYSFAMVLFEIICNEIPFEDLEFSAVFLAASRGCRPDLQAVPDRTPKDLVELMQQCWAGEPSERPSFEYISTALATIGRSAGMVMKWGDVVSRSTLGHSSQETTPI